jgi:hypothetical protein
VYLKINLRLSIIASNLLRRCYDEKHFVFMWFKWNRKNYYQQRTLNESRKAFDNVAYPKLDITNFSISEAAKTIITKARL